MKHTKRLLALLLTLVLALGLALPTFASTNPAMPVITKQPQSVTVLNGETYTFSIEAEIPNGDPLRYEWYAVDDTYPDWCYSTEASLSLWTGVQFELFVKSVQADFYCVVYNADDDSLFVQSEAATVTVLKDDSAVREAFCKLLLAIREFLLFLFFPWYGRL